MPSYHSSEPKLLQIGKKVITIITETPNRPPEELEEAAILASRKIREILKRYPEMKK